MQIKSGILISMVSLSFATDVLAESWRGLTIAPENRCSPYNSKDYSYPQSVEPKIIE